MAWGRRTRAVSALPDHTLVFVVRTDPHPDEIAVVLDGKGSVSKADSSRPELADLLEVKTRLLHKPKDPLLARSSREQTPRKSVIPAKAGIQRLP